MNMHCHENTMMYKQHNFDYSNMMHVYKMISVFYLTWFQSRWKNMFYWVFFFSITKHSFFMLTKHSLD